MREYLRLTLAVLISSVAAASFAPLLLLLSRILISPFHPPLSSLKAEITVSSMMYLFTLPISFAHVLLLGVPAFFFLDLFGFTKWWSMSIAGLAIGFLPLFVLLHVSDFGHNLGISGTTGVFVLFGYSGLVGGLFAWLAVRKINNHKIIE